MCRRASNNSYVKDPSRNGSFVGGQSHNTRSIQFKDEIRPISAVTESNINHKQSHEKEMQFECLLRPRPRV